MGIKHLLPFLQQVTNKVSLSHLEGLVAAVDASCWLHRACAISFKQYGDDQSVMEICKSYLLCLVRNNITPIIVFDGLPLPGKKKERERRTRLREAAKQKAKFLRSNGQTDKANQVLTGAIEIDYELVSGLINTCHEMSVRYIVAAYEADPQIVYLVKNGYADFAISEDSDLLAYGCNKILYKFSPKLDGVGDLIKLDDVLNFLEMPAKSFLDLCIVAGCDYVENIRNVGINTAFKLLKGNGKFLQHLQKLQHAPADYITQFERARVIFLHQTVFGPLTSKTIPLLNWEDNMDTAEKELFQTLCGLILQQEYAVNLATGNINPNDPHNIQQLFQKPLQGQMLQPTAIFLEVKSIGDVVTWTIPSFPVLNLNFKKTAAVIRGFQKPVVFEEARSIDIEVGDKIRCKKWCDIVMNDVTFLVAWEFDKVTKSVAQVDEEMAEVYAEELSDDQSNVVEHTLPFKVLGIMYKERQTYLKAASDSLASGQNVEVAIRPEPGNEHDRNAIAVSLNYGSGWKTVGYIAKELTCYLHPLINNGSLRVAIANLRFRVTHFLLGYYLTISITKNGAWCDQVVKASKKVS